MRALPFILSLALVAPAFAQAPAASPAPQTTPSPAPSPAASPSPAPSPTPTPAPLSLTGVWAGSATFATEGASPCRYSSEAAAAVTLEIRAAGETGTGKLSLKLAAPKGTACAAIHLRTDVEAMTLTPSTVSFRDGQGREWNLGLKEGALAGIFAGTGGSGEVQLKKTAAIVGGAGMGKGALGFVGANIVALGALVGINKVAQDNSSPGTSTIVCSPRACVQVSSPGQPCDCTPTQPNVVSGGSCGQTTSGLGLGAECSLPNRPCQSELSCDNGHCLNPFPQGGPCPITTSGP
jgi:hypothetical protein